MELMILLAAGATTWTLRASFIAMPGRRPLSPVLERVFAMARHAVLGALVASSVAGSAGVGALGSVSPQLIAAAAAAGVAWYSGGMMRTLVAGVATMAVAGQAL